ncbi:hypothetical protein [Cohnella mopanensis]|uniref:hypothetical protein n=1 Tax=Cohnella mopanensis TaxID=2911966 RepID=UPI001EF7DADD|nr:hypothetical protein [Cohnella mopanensis]
MNNKNTFIVMAIVMALILSSCSTARQAGPAVTVQATESQMTPNPAAKLPDNFSVPILKSALEEYMNYRLWFYPSKIKENDSYKSFDSHIGETVNVEVRLYSDGSGDKKVFAHTTIGEWLVLFGQKNNIVYADGQVGKEDTEWPQGNFEAAGTFSMQLSEPRKPNFGTSVRKEEMIEALEDEINKVCADLLTGSERDLWIDSQVYLADFYEYESIVSVWFVRPDGYVWIHPLGLAEQDGGFSVTGVKGFSISDMNARNENDFTRYLYEKEIQGAIKQWICSPKPA